MENEKNAQSGVRERRYYTVKNKFDELLIAVCEDMQKEELEAFHAIEVKPVTGPNLKISKKRYKSVYMAAAVVCNSSGGVMARTELEYESWECLADG